MSNNIDQNETIQYFIEIVSLFKIKMFRDISIVLVGKIILCISYNLRTWSYISLPKVVKKGERPKVEKKQ